MFGEITNPALAAIKDIDTRELVIFVPLIVGTIWLGVQPGLVLDYTAASVDAVVGGWRLATGG
jgi:NADH-quinone oxidoreductase subunit M